VTLSIVVVGYQSFGGPSASIFTSRRRWRQHGRPKRRYPNTVLHGVRSGFSHLLSVSRLVKCQGNGFAYFAY